MDIKTHVRKKNVKTAEKILRKGRGAWGDFVNKALESEATIEKNQKDYNKMVKLRVKEYKADKEAS